MAAKMPQPSRADLQNTMVKPKEWQNNQRYSRLVVVKSGYEFVYDTQDACWRRLDKPRQQPKAKPSRRSAEEREARRNAKREKRERRKARIQKMKHIKEGMLRWASTNWFRSRSGLLLLLAFLTLNAMYLPAYPIVAFVVGGTLTGIGLSLIIFAGNAAGSKSTGFALLVLFGGFALIPFLGMWALHGIIAALFQAL